MPQIEVIIIVGSRHVSVFCNNTLYVVSVWKRGMWLLLRLLTTLYHTKVIKSFFGIGITGNHYVSRAMIGRRLKKMVDLGYRMEKDK